MISIQKLNKYYRKGKSNEIHVINNTTLTLPKKGLICILGESGSGKTTLLNVVGGLDDFDSGTIEIDGVVIDAKHDKKFEQIKRVQYAHIFQTSCLLEDRTVEYNIQLALGMFELTKQELEERVDKALQAVDMWRYKKRLASNLSRGQQQRVAIARAIAKSPSVILADEPTGNLDFANTMRIMNLLKKVSSHCLVIMVTHETNLANFFADRILVIKNGQIISDQSQENKDGEQIYEDVNLYLKDYKETTITNNNLTISSFSNKPIPPLKLWIVYDNHQFYLHVPQKEKISFLEENSFRKMINESRPKLMDSTNQTEIYEFLPMSYKKGQSLPFKEIVRLAWNNFLAGGKKQAILAAALIIMAVLSVIATADFLTVQSVDLGSIVTTDSNELVLTTQKNDGFSNIEYDSYFYQLFEELQKFDKIEKFLFYFPVDLTYSYEGFEQLEGLNVRLTGYSFAPIEELSETMIVYGRMPENVKEVVLDLRVIERFLNSGNELTAVFTKPEELIGKELTIPRKDWKLKICGICDSQEPNLYLDPYTRLSISTWVGDFSSLEVLKEAYPNQYETVKLKENEILVSEKFYEQRKLVHNTETYDTPLGVELKIIGTYPNEFGFDFVISSVGYQSLLTKMLCHAKAMVIKTKEKEQVKQFISDGLTQKLQEKLQIFIQDPYEQQYEKYEQSRRIKLDARVILTITVVIISLVLLYITMRTTSIRKISQIAAYRLIGIPKSGIYKAYTIELFMISACTTIPTVFITSGILKFMASIRSLESNLVFPWYSIIFLALGLSLCNILIGLLPIRTILRLLPAKLITKYHISF